MRKRKWRPASSRSDAKLRATWVTQGPMGLVGGDAEQVHPAPVDLDHEKHGEAPQCDRVDGEEVGGQDALGLGTQELASGGARAPRRGREAMAAQDRGDTGLEDGDAELLELAHDAEVALARVVSCQANDQLDGLLGQGRTAGLPAGVGPSPSNEGTMPAQDRLGCAEEGCPPVTGDQASEGADERSIRPGEAGIGLALEHRQLVTQHEDLGVLGHRVHLVDADRFGDAQKEAVEEGERHEQRA